MSDRNKPFVFKVAKKEPRQFNRLAAGTGIGLLAGIILAYTVGPKDYAVILGVAGGAALGYAWDWWAARNKNKAGK